MARHPNQKSPFEACKRIYEMPELPPAMAKKRDLDALAAIQASRKLSPAEQARAAMGKR
jgi:hypothetical protein